MPSRPFNPTVRPLPPWAVELAPEPLREADAAHREAVERLSALRREAKRAEAEAEEAELADRKAAEAALAAGRKLPKAKAPAAAATAVEARRAADAAAELARGTQDSFKRAYNATREEFQATVAEVIAEHGGEGLLEEIEALLVRRRQLDALAKEVAYPIDGRPPSFSVYQPSRGQDLLQGDRREAVEALRTALAP